MISLSAAITPGPLRHVTGFPGFGLLRVLRPIPSVSAGNKPHLPASRLLAGEGTDGMVPTFGFQPFDRVGVQLCPCNLATACAAGIHRGLPIGDINRPRSSPHTFIVWVRVAARS